MLTFLRQESVNSCESNGNARQGVRRDDSNGSGSRRKRWTSLSTKFLSSFTGKRFVSGHEEGQGRDRKLLLSRPTINVLL